MDKAYSTATRNHVVHKTAETCVIA